ncbi:hypothetical protein H4582DRAFT_2052993 [Lactarius indigo]|nr:hypothetical protein H4582DRAFT_2052993 [Lactarius indigo]
MSHAAAGTATSRLLGQWAKVRRERDKMPVENTFYWSHYLANIQKQMKTHLSGPVVSRGHLNFSPSFWSHASPLSGVDKPIKTSPPYCQKGPEGDERHRGRWGFWALGSGVRGGERTEPLGHYLVRDSVRKSEQNKAALCDVISMHTHIRDGVVACAGLTHQALEPFYRPRTPRRSKEVSRVLRSGRANMTCPGAVAQAHIQTYYKSLEHTIECAAYYSILIQYPATSPNRILGVVVW